MTKSDFLTAPVLLGVVAGLFAGQSYADESPWYATANVGVGNLASATLTYSDGSASDSFKTDFDASFAGGGTLGYQFDNGLSVEGEIMYRRNEFDNVDLPGAGGSFTGGDFASLGIGANLLYRFPIGSSGKWSGYAGPGILYLQEIDIDFDNDGAQEVSFETDDSGLQFKLGGRYDVSERLFLEADATYFSADSIRMELGGSSTETIESDYQHWTVSLRGGIRF